MVSDLSAEHVAIASARSSTRSTRGRAEMGRARSHFAPACQPFIRSVDPAIVEHRRARWCHPPDRKAS
jgi:hypothetical protein